ncbi:MAG: SDR family oxidoreductase [Ectothiorhodospiraceae bacterium]|jgi:NAD(P)-dependent dehydrogenase (short-subunit alcohol dehydrogenase family)
MSEQKRVALVTGANRGIGFETSRQLARLGYRTVLTGRDGLQGKAAADKLVSEDLDVSYHPLDITREESVLRLREYVEKSYARLDVLINNAGIFPEYDPEHGSASPPGVMDVDLQMVRDNLETNALSPLRLTQELLPLMRRSGYGRIVNVSTGYGQLSGMGRGFPAYRISKTALNAVTRLFAAETQEEDIRVNSVDPGWVRTRMGGPKATRSPAEAAEWIVQAATLPADGPTGAFLRNGEPVSW